MVYKILSPLSRISVISAKVKFYRLSITLLQSVCLMCLEIWNLKINRLILVPQNIYPFKECRSCVQDGEPFWDVVIYKGFEVHGRKSIILRHEWLGHCPKDCAVIILTISSGIPSRSRTVCSFECPLLVSTH